MHPKAQQLIERGALFVVNHSGGKDSQAMYLYLRTFVPKAQMVIVHADLAEVEWKGAVEHIETTTDGEPIHVCKSRRGLLQMIEERGMFPSPSQRQCTSDLKRGPIERTIRGLVKERTKQVGWQKARLIVNCMGMRAEESPGRAKLETFKLSKSNSVADREWYDWLPIHSWTKAQVFKRIADAGQKPHAAYAAGMSRFSCCFCIMSSKEDLTTAAKLSITNPEMFNDPDLYKKYVGLEKSTGQVMLMPSKTRGRQSLEDVTGVLAT